MAGRTVIAPTVARLRASRGGLADGEDEAGAGDEGVPPGVHREAAALHRLAADPHGVAHDPGGAGDDAHREAVALEHRALLDVQLEVGDGGLEPGARRGRRVEVDPMRGAARRPARRRRGR